jgi:glycosyltransferase involved in cell wall biosynthesis
MPAEEGAPGRRLRVMQVCGSTGGGVGRHVRDLAVALAARHDVLLAGPEPVLAGIQPPVRTAVVDIADRPRVTDWAATRRLRALARGADVIHAHGLRAGSLAAFAVAGLRRRPALVVTLHNLPVGGAKVRAISAALERIVARRADAVLGVSSDLVDRAAARGSALAERALVPAPPRRPASPLTAGQRAELGLADGAALVLTVARLAPQKGLRLLADAAALLAASAAQPFVWAVAGDGPLEGELRERIEAEHLPVRLLGRRDDVPDLLAAAEVVVSTSAWEGQPLGVQEALGAGVPVVATDVGGTREVTGDAAVLVAYPDAPALADAVRALLADPGRRAELAAAARRRAGELPTLADVLAQIEFVYARVLG